MSLYAWSVARHRHCQHRKLSIVHQCCNTHYCHFIIVAVAGAVHNGNTYPTAYPATGHIVNWSSSLRVIIILL